MPIPGRRLKSPITAQAGLFTVKREFFCTEEIAKDVDKVARKYKLARTIVLRDSMLLGLPLLKDQLAELRKKRKI